jgi:hypothetical protein
MSKTLTFLYNRQQRAQACRMNEGDLWRFATVGKEGGFHGVFNVSEQLGGE